MAITNLYERARARSKVRQAHTFDQLEQLRTIGEFVRCENTPGPSACCWLSGKWCSLNVWRGDRISLIRLNQD